MRNYLINLLQQVQSLDMTGIISQLIVAAVIGFAIYLSYYLSHSGTV